MSTPGPLQPSASVQLTLQQLDELEALVQRMLALPVNPSGDDERAESGETPAIRSEGPEETVAVLDPAPAFSLAELTLPQESEGPSLDSSEWPSKDFPAVDEEPDGGGRRPSDAKVVGWLLPLVWLNWLFDQGTRILGPLGRWLRGTWGRALLGWMGLLLLATALAWLVIDGMGWTW